MQSLIVSILHYNNPKDTVGCLDSLTKSNLPGISLKTFVLDNGSSEELELDTTQYEKINLSLIRVEKNYGFTGGHNLIYEKTQNTGYDFFLLLNNDSILQKDCIKELVYNAEKQKADACVPKIYFTKGREYHKDRYNTDESGRVLWYAGGEIDWLTVMSNHVGLDEVDKGLYDEIVDASFATGACLLLRKSMLEKVGLFDEKYFLYFEDADLCVKILKKKGIVKYIPSAVLWHSNAGSSGSGSSLHDYYLTRNRMLFGMRYAPVWTKVHLVKESLRLIREGRYWQKKGIRDYYLGKFGKGSFAP
jgi:GT2 family glycosyltransferase